MSEPCCVRNFEKIVRVRVDEREAEVAVRIQYSVEDNRGCKIYTIGHIEAFAD